MMSGRMGTIRIIVLLVLPLTLISTGIHLTHMTRPYWSLDFFDPDYNYLFNALNLAESKPIYHLDHPGTTLQMLGAVTLKIAYAFESPSNGDLAHTVLKHPERYLSIMNMVLQALNVLLIFLAGWVTFKLTRNLWLGLLLQFSPFFSTTTLFHGLPRVSAEPLLLFSGLLLSMIIVMMTARRNSGNSDRYYLIFLALVSGFGMATKVTFLPLLIIPLFVLPGFKKKSAFVILTCLSFVLWTSPIICQYDRLFSWLYRIFTHSGIYGGGDAGIIDINVYGKNLENIFISNIYFFFVWGLGAGFAALSFLSKQIRQQISQKFVFKALLAVVLSQFCTVLMVAKHYDCYYSSNQYLLPALSLSGLLLFLLYKCITAAGFFSSGKGKMHLIIFVFLIFSSVVRLVVSHQLFTEVKAIKAESLAVNARIEKEYANYLKIYYYPSFSLIYALHFGNSFSNYQYSRVLEQIYGEAHFYDVWNGTFYTWSKTKMFLMETVLSRGYGDKIVFHGMPVPNNQFKLATGAYLPLIDVYGGKYQTIYLPGIENISGMQGQRG